jgi:XisH protein
MAKDLFHIALKNALKKDGWTVTHDPFPLTSKSENMDYEIDLGAERILAAERGTEQIAVEIKSFLKPSLVNEFHSILGQYLVYNEGLKQLNENRVLYLALPAFADVRMSDYPFIQHLVTHFQVKIIVFDEINQIITQWKK